MSAAPALDDARREAIRAAARWHVRLCDEGVRPEDIHAHQRWLDEHPIHAWAWRLVERLRGELNAVPAELSAHTLRTAATRDGRRQMRRRLLLVATLAGGGWAGSRLVSWREWSADVRTGTGEQRSIVMADGSRLMLDTRSALDVRYGPAERALRLREGRVMIRTAADPHVPARPFVIDTPHGRLRALGTRFAVDVGNEETKVSVFEHAVQIHPAGAASRRVPLAAGWQCRFDARHVAPPRPLAPSDDAWMRGLLIVDAWPLVRLLQQLSRYRPGYLGCDPAVAELRISGAFPLSDTDRALDAVQRALPVRIRHRSRYWVTVEPAAA
ncbi:DUF4880 domain-containing protein [Verticiella sediminum]|uniref:DUF4880 domain-containing protein n=1 Tax=Verticiella sediminum TaxID=1247510 RepID=A0A556B0W4_9BURK|nr:FecR domain-containing protein [Verticiella sediminum]TSH98826.1 DUF4880 domain-containing protein [Verticiella sediminum]